MIEAERQDAPRDGAANGPGVMRVWDPLLRILHWTLVAGVLTAWATTKLPGVQWANAAKLHEWAGYVVLAVVALRLIWGFCGPRYARFSQFVRGPLPTLAYAKQVAAHAEPRHIGHNPLGAWMIVALLVCAALASATGWLYTTDRFWGIEWVEKLHDGLAHLLLALAALHVAGALFASWRHRENLPAAMLSGNKRAPQPGDVT